ncbi:LysR substrate-binding domain-containing protein [Luteolibacter sp. SL250]|nr:LysR substrate-binding domain-containing protein [Luteolibacter sp. SL250]
MDVGLRSLRYFLTVAEEENISRAAERLHIAQPALSRRMSDLESQMGISLFVRTGRSIRLTFAGQHFLTQARDLISRLDRIFESVRELDGQQSKELRVGYVPSMSSRILPEVLKEMRRACPWIRVTLFDLDTSSMVKGLADGDLGAALLVRIPGTPLRGIDYHEITRHSPCVVMSTGHPLSARDELDVAEITGFPIVVFCRKGYPEHHRWLEGIFGRPNQMKIQTECDSVASMLAMVESGEGVAVVQEGFESLSPGLVVARPIRNAVAHRFSFGIACRSRESSPELQELVRLVIASAGKSGSFGSVS